MGDLLFSGDHVSSIRLDGGLVRRLEVAGQVRPLDARSFVIKDLPSKQIEKLKCGAKHDGSPGRWRSLKLFEVQAIRQVFNADSE